MRKVKLSVCSIMLAGLIGIFLLGSNPARGDWKLYSSTTDSDFFYSDEKEVRPSLDIIGIQTKEVYSEWRLQGIRLYASTGELPPELEKLSYTIVLREINCKENRWRNVSITNYSQNGEVITASSPSEEWFPIFPSTIHEKLFKEFCGRG